MQWKSPWLAPKLLSTRFDWIRFSQICGVRGLYSCFWILYHPCELYRLVQYIHVHTSPFILNGVKYHSSCISPAVTWSPSFNVGSMDCDARTKKNENAERQKVQLHGTIAGVNRFDDTHQPSIPGDSQRRWLDMSPRSWRTSGQCMDGVINWMIQCAMSNSGRIFYA